MRKPLIAASLLTVFLFAVLAPIAIADDGDNPQSPEEKKDAKEQEREERRAEKEERKEERKELKEERKELKEERKDQRRGFRLIEGNVSLDLSGTAVGKDNVTYGFELTADGQGVERVKVKEKHNETYFRYQAKFLAHVVFRDANGTVVKEGDIRVKLYARGHGDEVKWVLGAIGKRDSDMPKLVLKGEAERISPGVFELEGKGHAVFKLDGSERATPVRVKDVSGTFERDVPLAVAPVAA